MKTLFTKSTVKFGCYAENNNQQNQFLPKEEFTIADVLTADVPIKDKAWFIRKNCEFTTDQYRQFAIGCALCVLPIYEAKYPGNNAPREAIQAAKDYLAGIISIEVLREKRRNAAAYAAADAADAAYAAADAADAADAAAYAAADAADAADAAAYAAAYAAYAADAAADAADAAYAAYAAADAAYAAYAAAKNGKQNYQYLLLQFFKEFTLPKETV